MARALVLASEGRARAAREALLLGQRFVRAAEVLAGAGAAGAATEAAAPDDKQDDPRAELERRLGHLLDAELKRRAAARAGETAQDRDLPRFQNADGTPRLATPEENAAIAAGRRPWANGRKFL